MEVNFIFFQLVLFICVGITIGLANEAVVEELLKENIALKKELLSLRGDYEAYKTESDAQSKLMWKKMKQLEADLVETKRSKRLLSPVTSHNVVAFSASLSNHMMNLGNSQAIVFDNVFSNNGNGYSSRTGAFTAAHNGTYFFAATIMSHSAQYLETEICLNGKTQVLMYSYDNSFEQGTNSVVLNLNEGDQVWVRHHGNEGTNVYGGHWSSFSGFMISG